MTHTSTVLLTVMSFPDSSTEQKTEIFFPGKMSNYGISKVKNRHFSFPFGLTRDVKCPNRLVNCCQKSVNFPKNRIRKQERHKFLPGNIFAIRALTG